MEARAWGREILLCIRAFGTLVITAMGLCRTPEQAALKSHAPYAEETRALLRSTTRVRRCIPLWLCQLRLIVPPTSAGVPAVLSAVRAEI